MVAVILTTWAIAATTQDAAINRLDEQVAIENEITEQLNLLALDIDEWQEAIPAVLTLAAQFDVRIALTDVEGRTMVDTEPGPILMLEMVPRCSQSAASSPLEIT